MSLQLWHRKRKPVEKRLGTDYHLTWEKRTLPGAGAGQYAFETYGLPAYARFGFGNIPVTNPLRETAGNAFAFQAVGIVGIPASGQLQGQFVTQPLMDPQSAENAGLILPGAVPNMVSYNGITNGAKATLNP